jgi:transposase
VNLKVGKSNGRVYLSIVQGYRDKDSRTVKTKTIESLGYLDDLKEKYDDPEAHYKAVVAEMNKKKAESKEPATASITFVRDERLKQGRGERKNIGYAALSKIYHGLGLHTFLNNRSYRWKTEYNVDSVMRLLVFSRILDPASKKKTFERKEMYFEKTDFSLADVYRCLSKVVALKQAIAVHLYKQTREMCGSGDGIVYYDVTNYYFEIDEQDEMRKKGVSKEHRPDPIIQMGLLTDSSGIPIIYDTFPGNTNDCETYVPIFKELHKNFNLGRVVVVADKGINTGNNIAYCLLSGNGYVFSQTIRGGTGELKKYVLSKDDYKSLDGGFKIKSRQYPRIVHVTDDNGKKKNVALDEKQIVFYSPDYDRRAKAERAAAIAKARDLVKDPSKYKKATSYGAAKYVKDLVFDKKTGEILTASHKPIFDEKKLLEEEKYDGYYAIVTSEWKESDEKILDVYRGLWQIEEAFRVCKSDLETRPVYLSRAERIEAHFLVCFIALVLTRLLARLLDGQFSVGRIADSLGRASGSYMEENWYHFDYADEVTQAVHEKMGIDLGRKYMTNGEIRRLIGGTKK